MNLTIQTEIWDLKLILIHFYLLYSYQSMIRLLKKYKFHYSRSAGSGKIPGHTLTMSSYPGTLFSGDDFYITSTGMVWKNKHTNSSNFKNGRDCVYHSQNSN